MVVSGGILASVLAGRASESASRTTTKKRATAVAEMRDTTTAEAVDLTLSGSPHPSLIGTFGGHHLHLKFKNDVYGGDILGSIAGDKANVDLTVGNNAATNPVPAKLKGTYSAGSVDVTGKFKLSSFVFESGTVSGKVGADKLRATVTNPSGQPIGVVKANGTYGSVPFSLTGQVAGELSSGEVSGTVGGHDIKLIAKRHDGKTKITGSFRGEPALLAIIVGAVLYFV